MKVLIDECAPRALKQALSSYGYDCHTVQDAGWSGKTNGELLGIAESDFDALVTLDTNLSYQQNLSLRKIAIEVVRERSNRLRDLSVHFPAVANALQWIKPCEIVYVGIAP